jgi:hypothetical protein
MVRMKGAYISKKDVDGHIDSWNVYVSRPDKIIFDDDEENVQAIVPQEKETFAVVHWKWQLESMTEFLVLYKINLCKEELCFTSRLAKLSDNMVTV